MNPALVILNLFQDPFLTIDGGLFGEIDPKQVQDKVVVVDLFCTNEKGGRFPCRPFVFVRRAITSRR
jgi:hypothetical protein